MTSYTALRTQTKPQLDGRLDSAPWLNAPRTQRFVDMGNGQPALLDTTAAVLWDDEALYIGFWIEEPYPKAKLTERDSIIFQENDVEVFIDGGDCYYEFEINALGTVYEILFVWRDALKKGSRFDKPEFDLLEREALSFAGDFDRTQEHFWWGSHPRGPRWAFLDWDFPGMQSAVHVDGQLNQDSEPSKGWTVELAFPWAGMSELGHGRSIPPKDGDTWKLFLGRFQKIQLGDKEVQAAWCATPHGTYDTHMPDKFTPVVFSTNAVP